MSLFGGLLGAGEGAGVGSAAFGLPGMMGGGYAGYGLGDDLTGGGGGLFGDMFGGGNNVSSSYVRNGDNSINSANIDINGTDIPLNNPGTVNPMVSNPYVGNILNNEQGLYSQFSNSAAGGAFNPSFYNNMMNTQQNQLTSSLGNQYAARGLSGSSAELGGLNQAIQGNQMSWLNRQQSDQMRAMQGLSGLNNQMYGQTMGVQNQYGNFQDTFGQDVLGAYGMNQQQNIANNQMMASIFGSLLGAGGMAAGAMA